MALMNREREKIDGGQLDIKDTVVAISCLISPDQRAYIGNYVVVAVLRGSTPV